MDRSGIVADKEQEIYEVFDGVIQNKVIGTYIWVRDHIFLDGIETECFKKIEKYNSGYEVHTKTFIYDGNIVFVHSKFVDTADYDYEFLNSVSFTKLQIGR